MAIRVADKMLSFDISIDQGVLNYQDKDRKAYQEAHKNENVRFRVRPSNASLIVPLTDTYTELIGDCNRKCFFEHSMVPESNPLSVKSIRRMQAGRDIEKQEHMYADCAPGITIVGHNMRMKTPLIDDVVISMELDTLLKDADKDIAVLEIKSFYGYQAHKEIFGSKDSPGFPKGQNLLQVMMYLYSCAANKINAKYAILHYIDRTDFSEKKFIVELGTRSEEACAVVDGVMDNRFRLSGILTRYTVLAVNMKKGALPPRDGEVLYSDRKIEALVEIGKISQNQFKLWKKGEVQPGDWQCSYCSWKNLCYGNKPDKRETWPTDEQILQTMHTGKIVPVIEQSDTDEGWT